MKYIKFNLHNDNINCDLSVKYYTLEKRMVISYDSNVVIEFIGYDENIDELIESDEYNIKYIGNKSKIININNKYVLSNELVKGLYKFLSYMSSDNIIYITKYISTKIFSKSNITELYGDKYLFKIVSSKVLVTCSFIIKDLNKPEEEIFEFNIGSSVKDIIADNEGLLTNLLYF